MFSHFGAVTAIELPMKNLAIERELKDKLDHYQKERRERDAVELKKS